MSHSITFKEGFNSLQLKLIAVICMTLDHIEYYLSGILPVPFWFGIIGRIAAPLFFFCTAKGLFYTHDRIAYCRRLYIASVLMAFGNALINMWIHHPHGITVDNAIFETLFYVAFFVTVLEKLRSCQTAFDTRGSLRRILLLLLPFVIAGIEHFLPGGTFRNILQILFPSPFDVEGGFIWILFGVGLFYSANHKTLLSRYYLAVCLIFFVLEASYGFSVQNLIIENHQWLMVLALPFILLYNEQKGSEIKWFFYIYYPAHVYVLAIAATVL